MARGQFSLREDVNMSMKRLSELSDNGRWADTVLLPGTQEEQPSRLQQLELGYDEVTERPTMDAAFRAAKVAESIDNVEDLRRLHVIAEKERQASLPPFPLGKYDAASPAPVRTPLPASNADISSHARMT